MAKRIGILCFSPTKTTRRICDAVALGMGVENPAVLDGTSPDIRARIMADSRAALDGIDHLIVGAPVHMGKIPIQAQECLRSLHGDGRECTAIVMYGTRDYGAAPHQMLEILSNDGFKVVAAGIFIGQHSYSDMIPAGMGRPDKSDIEKAIGFGARISGASRHLTAKDVPAHIDLMSRSGVYSMLKPHYDEKRCLHCHECAKACPSGLISPDTDKYFSEAAKKTCIGCMACVRRCKAKARATKANPIMKLILISALKPGSKERKEPVTIV